MSERKKAIGAKAPPQQMLAALVQPLEDGGNPLPATDTHGHQPHLLVSQLQFLHELDCHDSTGGPHRVSQDMPLPLTLVFSISRPSSRMQYRAWAAKASFSSMRSLLLRATLALLRTLRTAGTGPVPIRAGSTPATALDTHARMGVRPRALAFSSAMMTTDAAASLMPEACPQ